MALPPTGQTLEISWRIGNVSVVLGFVDIGMGESHNTTEHDRKHTHTLANMTKSYNIEKANTRRKDETNR